MPDLRSTALIVAATLIGLVAFSELPGYTHALLIFIPVIWAKTHTRLTAGMVIAAYGAAVSRGIPESVYAFYHSDPNALFTGYAIWLAATLSYFLIGILPWHKNQQTRIFLIPALILLWIIPPFGLIGWGNPIAAAGWIFPHWHWFGLIATIATPMLIAYRYPFALLPLFVFVVSHKTTTLDHPDWHAHDTQYEFGITDEKRDLLDEFNRHRDMSYLMRKSTKPNHLLPESVGGTWNYMATRYWQARIEREPTTKQVLIGAEIIEAKKSYNSIISLTEDSDSTVYRQRVPVPLIMWKPFAEHTSTPSWSTPVAEVNNQATAFLICYETLIALPALHSLLFEPEHLITVSSTWWSPQYIKQAQSTTSQSWARLFNIPLTESFNKKK